MCRGFANAYADWLQQNAAKGLHGYNVSIRVRKHVVMRSEAKPPREGLAVTGLTALIQSGLQLQPTSYTDYYYDLSGRKSKLRIEEQFAHALLLATLPQHAADRTALSFFLAGRNDLNYRLLSQEVKLYYVSGIYEELRRVNELVEKSTSLAIQKSWPEDNAQ